MSDWKERVERAFEAFNRRDLTRAAGSDDLNDDVEWIDPGLPGPLRGVAAVRMFMGSLINAFPDAKMTVRSAIEGNDAVAVEYTWTGTHLGPLPMGSIPATGKQVRIESCMVFATAGGRISRVRVYPDNLTLLAQLGLANAPVSA